MAIVNWIEKLGRAIFEAPFEAIEVARGTPELAEIRLAMLDEVKARTHRAGGREVFPHNLVRIYLAGVPEEQNRILAGRFFADFCQGELQAGLAKSGYHFPRDLEVEVHTAPELPGPGEQWVRVEAASRPRTAPATHPKRTARLVVVRGAANVAELPLAKARTNIGRTVDVFRADGPSRRNDLAFDEENEFSKTVSREHAHVLYSKQLSEYRLFNDRPGPKSGLWITRDGLSHEVQRGERGVKLMQGDEISLGRAVVKFTLR